MTSDEVENTLFEWRDGCAFYRGLAVNHEKFEVASKHFTVACLLDAAALLDHDDFARSFLDDDRAPYGMEIWPSSTMMAKHILEGEDGAGKNALDLGCGLGLVSLAGTLKGWRMTAADHEPIALEFARYNAALNKIDIAEFADLDWNHPAPDRKFHRIFAGDILYELINHQPILNCIRQLLTEDGMVFITDPLRRLADRFEALAVENGFAVDVIPTSHLFRDRGDVEGRIFQLSKK